MKSMKNSLPSLLVLAAVVALWWAAWCSRKA